MLGLKGSGLVRFSRIKLCGKLGLFKGYRAHKAEGDGRMGMEFRCMKRG